MKSRGLALTPIFYLSFIFLGVSPELAETIVNQPSAVIARVKKILGQ